MSEGPTIGDWTQYECVPDNASSFPARIRLRDTAWMVYYEPDVTGLKAEVVMLRKENERLHADQAHWELGNCPNCLNVVSLQEALEQNAKLRELMYERAHVYAIQNMTEDELRITATNVMEDNAKLRELFSSYWKRTHSPVGPNVERDYLSEMRELGIEVDK